MYGQLKKSPHDVTGVLGSSAVSMASQATRLGKGSSVMMMGIKGFDHETKVKARSEKQNLQTASQLCTKQVGTGEINQIIESLLKVECPKNNQSIFNRNLRRKEMFLVSTRVNSHCNRISKARVHLTP